MTPPDAASNARARRESQQDDEAADGDGLAQATQGKQTGEGLESQDDTADGEDAKR